MFFSSDDISETEKINRIYSMLRAERRGRIFGLILKLSLIVVIVYGYYYLSLPAHEDIRKKMIETVQAKMTELILPMVGGMVQDLTQSMWIPTSATTPTTTNKKNIPTNSTTLPAGITPEMIKAVQDAMQKK